MVFSLLSALTGHASLSASLRISISCSSMYELFVASCNRLDLITFVLFTLRYCASAGTEEVQVQKHLSQFECSQLVSSQQSAPAVQHIIIQQESIIVFVLCLFPNFLTA